MALQAFNSDLFETISYLLTHAKNSHCHLRKDPEDTGLSTTVLCDQFSNIRMHNEKKEVIEHLLLQFFTGGKLSAWCEGKATKERKYMFTD